METYKSPRKVEEEIRAYKYKRFEDYMRMADDGTLTRELAIAAFKDEDTTLLWVEDNERELSES